jgi:NAD(P)-dependent dehydrogenase (short-subunit alcohol dehydrogenase family)
MFKDRTVLITGSTSGIGLGIAEYFASSGARTVLNGMGNADDIEATRADRVHARRRGTVSGCRHDSARQRRDDVRNRR